MLKRRKFTSVLMALPLLLLGKTGKTEEVSEWHNEKGRPGYLDEDWKYIKKKYYTEEDRYREGCVQVLRYNEKEEYWENEWSKEAGHGYCLSLQFPNLYYEDREEYRRRENL